jgi:SMI1 / KNR4 family (SUKH-1)
MKFAGNPGVSEPQVAAVQVALGLNLPPDYTDFFRRFNGGEGFVGNEYLMLWKLEDLDQFNREYEVAEYLPDVLLFGSDGGGEAYGFQTGVWEVIRVLSLVCRRKTVCT